MTALALMVALPAPARAQAETDESCSVTVSPGNLPAGVVAVEATVFLSRDIGRVREVAIPRESGISLTSVSRLRKLFSARDDEAPPEPVRSHAESGRATLWLDLMDARAGGHRIRLLGTAGSCSGTLVVG